MRITTKAFRNVSIAIFLIVSLLVVGGFAQETKKLKPKPSSPFKCEEKVAVNSAGILLGPMKAPLNPSLKEPTFRDRINPTQSYERQMDEELMGIQKKRKKVTVDDDIGLGDYSDIQEAINGELDGTDIEVMPGTYSGFTVVRRHDLKIKGKKGEKHDPGVVIVTGSVEPALVTYRGTDSLTIGVVESTKIEISGFIVQAGFTDPFTIAYFNSTGKVKNNEVSGNTGDGNPGNSIAAFGITSPGTVKIEHNFIHDYGKIGILVNSWDPTAGAYVSGGIYAEIKHNVIIGTDFIDYYRVQDGIQVTYGGSAKIEDNNISRNFQTGGSYWTCDGILITDAFEVETKKNKIYDNQMGITIQKYVTYAKLEDDDIEYNGWGIYTWNWIASIIEVKKAKIKQNEIGWINYDTDGIVFEHCHIEKNTYGLYDVGFYTGGLILNPTATFNNCKITKNTDYDVIQRSSLNTLVFHKTKYDTYYNFGGGTLIVL